MIFFINYIYIRRTKCSSQKTTSTKFTAAGSFSAAARNLYITQPAISIAVKKEEQELGQPIFERSSSRLLLTDAGRAYIDAVEKLHRIEEDLKGLLGNDLSNLKTGALRIGASSFFLSSIVLPVVAEYSRRYPGISLDVQEAPSLELQKRLANEALDILVDPVDQQCDTFNSVILFEDHFLLAVPDAPNFFASMGIKKDLLPAAFTADEIRRGVHLDPAAPSVSLSSFAKAPFLLLRPETIAYERAVKLCSQNGFAPNIRLQLDQLATAYRSCGAGLGVTLLSDTVVRMSDHDEPVVFYKLDSDDVSRNIAVMWKKKRYVSKAMEEFTKLAVEMFSG